MIKQLKSQVYLLAALATIVTFYFFISDRFHLFQSQSSIKTLDTAVNYSHVNQVTKSSEKGISLISDTNRNTSFSHSTHKRSKFRKVYYTPPTNIYDQPIKWGDIQYVSPTDPKDKPINWNK